MSERDTGELIRVLGDDFQRCYGNVIADVEAGNRNEDGSIEADHEFNARQLIRAAFAYLEGVTYSIKIAAVDDAIEKGVEITPEEVNFAFEISHSLSDKGRIVERSAHINLARNIRFAFSLYEKTNSIKEQFNPSEQWWNELQKAVAIRDRLTHPRQPEDLDLQPSEVLTVVAAVRGFEAHVMSYIEANA